MTNPFDTRGFSELSIHPDGCCKSARTWLVSRDRASQFDASALDGPDWLAQHYTWGPTTWPLHWCDAVTRREVDCGVLASFAREVFDRRQQRACKVQVVESYPKDWLAHWRHRWHANNCETNWIGQSVVYHEATAVFVSPHTIQIWDPSSNTWLHPSKASYGAVLYVRLEGSDIERELTWDTTKLRPNYWNDLCSSQA